MENSNFFKNIENEALKQGMKLAKQLAEETSKELTNEALKQVGDFYTEYTPAYYQRHVDSIGADSGLGRTVNPILEKSENNKGYIGGIEISTQHMFTDYKGTCYQVLASYLDGFHGLPTFGHYLREINETEKFKYLENYKDAIIRRFK